LSEKTSSKVVQPTPGFCIKGFQVNEDAKFFINICHCDGIPSPLDISEAMLTSILHSDEPHSYKVPMSLSDPRLASDKTGKQEMACDIAINSFFYEKIMKPGLFQNFFITLIFEALENKYSIELKEDNWLMLKNRAVFGSLVPHRIQDRDAQSVKYFKNTDGKQLKSKPLIEELRISSKTNPGDMLNIYDYDSSKTVEHKLIQETKHGQVVRLIAQFQLSNCVSAEEISLEVNDDRLVLECRKQGYMFDGYINGTIEVDEVTSQFDPETKTLTVELPSAKVK